MENEVHDRPEHPEHPAAPPVDTGKPDPELQPQDESDPGVPETPGKNPDHP